MNRMLFVIWLFAISCQSNSDSTNSTDTRYNSSSSNYQTTKSESEIKQDLLNLEQTNPKKHLSVSVDQYWKNIVGESKVRIRLSNSATLASFKDVRFIIDYYTKTNTKISTQYQTLYESLSVGESKLFKLSIPTIANSSSVEISVDNATPL